MSKVRRSILSGQWYSGDPEKLKQNIINFENQSPDPNIDFAEIKGIIAPHAGHTYSGKGAVSGYKLLAGRKYKNIIIMAPSHSSYFKGIACSVYDSYETPLGRSKVNQNFIKRLLASDPLFKIEESAEDHEHSAEIHLPFIQHYLKEIDIIPLIIGQITLDDIQRAKTIFDSIIEKDTLIIASSDFTHYGYAFGYNPFDNFKNMKTIRDSIEKLDMDHINFIRAFDHQGFLRLKKETGATICGYLPIALLISFLGEKDYKTYLASYYTSGDLTGDYDQTVSYGTIVFYK